MPYLNRYAFVGNLTKAPELRLPPTEGKQALCVLHVAINRNTRDEIGEKRTRTTFINDIEVWGATGEACAQFLTTGSMVLIEARVEADQWMDKQTGAKRTRLKVVAENVQFLRIKRTEDAVAPLESIAAEPAPAPEIRKTRRPGRASRAASETVSP